VTNHLHCDISDLNLNMARLQAKQTGKYKKYQPYNDMYNGQNIVVFIKAGPSE